MNQTKTDCRIHYIFLRRFSSHGSFGGLENRLLNWFKKINITKYKITLAVNQGAKKIFLNNPTDFNNIQILEFIDKCESNFFKRFIHMYCVLRKLLPDCVVFVEGAFGDFGLPEILAGFILTKGNIYLTEHSGATLIEPTPSHFHFGVIPGIGLWRYKKLFSCWLCGRLAKRIFAVSNEVKNRLNNFYAFPKKKIIVQYHGIDLAKFRSDIKTRNNLRKQLKISENEKIIITCGRLAKEKATHRLINAFDILEKKYDNLHLFLCGDGPLRNELEALVKQKETGNKIRFLGFQDDVSGYLKMSDIFVLPSVIEGFGISLVEAMACGLTVISTQTPGPSEIIENGVNGFLVENSEQGVINGLQQALSLDENRYRIISRNARRFCEEHLALEKCVKNELEIIGLN